MTKIKEEEEKKKKIEEERKDEEFRPTPKCFVKGCPNRYKTHSHPEFSTSSHLQKKRDKEIRQFKENGFTHLTMTCAYDPKQYEHWDLRNMEVVINNNSVS
jgi:hypothetical protein